MQRATVGRLQTHVARARVKQDSTGARRVARRLGAAALVAQAACGASTRRGTPAYSGAPCMSASMSVHDTLPSDCMAVCGEGGADGRADGSGLDRAASRRGVVSSTSTGAGGRASSCGDAAPAGDAGCGGMAHGADGGRQQVVVGGGCGWLRGAGRSCCPWERGSVRSSLPGGEVESGQARLEPWRAGVVQRSKRLERDEAAASNLRFQGVVHERGDCVTWRGGAG
jgi:hypothetical protein